MIDFNQQLQLAQQAEIIEKDFEKAKRLYLELTVAFPDRLQPFYYLGVLEANLGNMKSAIDYMLQSVDICPFYEGYKYLAVFYVIEKNLNTALKYFKLTLLYNSNCQETINLYKQLFPTRPLPCKPSAKPIGMYKSSKDCSLLKYTTIYPAEIIKRNSPKSVEEILTVFQKKQIEDTVKGFELSNCAESFVLKIPNGRVYIKQGEHPHFITTDNKFLEDMIVEKNLSFEDYSINKNESFPQETMVANKLLVLSSAWGGNYYHWLTWTIPRLEMIKKAGYKLEEFDKIVVDYLGFKFQKDLIEKLGISKNKIIATIPNGALLRANTIVTASLPHHLHTQQFVTNSVRNRLLKPEYINESSPKRIYISRNKGGTRRILNEDVLYLFLLNYGFKIIFAEDLTLEQQVTTFANAEIVVAPHGAGLINLTFCNEDTKVIEMFNEKMKILLDTGYFRICANCKLDHYIMYGEPIDNEAQDMTVDISKLEKTFQLANITKI